MWSPRVRQSTYQFIGHWLDLKKGEAAKQEVAYMTERRRLEFSYRRGAGRSRALRHSRP
jgi:hypothetical protein